MTAMRLVFLGSGSFGLPTLEALTECEGAFHVALIVSQPDRPAGRKRVLTPTAISQWALDHDVPLLRTENINSEESVHQIRAVGADAMVVIAFGQKIGPAVLGDTFAINLHASLLPKYRGAAPFQRAVMNADLRTGVSVITIADRMDAGDVLGSAATSIGPTETAGELHDRLSQLGVGVVLDVLRRFGTGSTQRTVQDESQVTMAAKLNKSDAWVDFSMTADEVRARINGLNPWPGCDVTVGSQRVKLRRAAVADGCDEPDDLKTGTHLGEGIVKCGDGCVRLLEVQPEGGRVMTFAEFSRGRGWERGAGLVSVRRQ